MKQAIHNFFSDWGHKGWFALNIFFTIMYLMWRIFFTIPFGYGIVSVIAGISLLIIETLGMVEALVHYVNMFNVRGYKLPEVPKELFPHVDVFIATYNEETSLIAKTVYACKRMEYPDPKKVHIYVCDDGHREEMKLLARQMGVNYLDRETHAGQKAGNLNNALEHSSSPYVVTLDADMQPQSCFLMETIPYFVDAELRNQQRDPEDQIPLGFLQTPQAFYDLDLFQFNLFSENKIPNEQDYFYRDIECARTRTNSCIYGGSNTVLSRKALEDIGGFFTDAITEDFATGILIQRKGYVSLATGKPLASGMSPKSLQDLIQQRVRWARGVISTGRKMHIYTASDLSFGQKMNYWASIWYWYAPIKRFCYIMSPLLYAVFGFMVFRCTLLEVLIFWLPMYVTSNISLKRLSNNIRNTKWTSIYEYALFPFMMIPVVLETFGISLKKFKVTSKGGNDNKKTNIVYLVPILILIVLSVIGIINCVKIMFDSGSVGPIVVLFWIVANLFNMVMCAFFIAGRPSYRKFERISVSLPGIVHVDGQDYECITRDISEHGASIYLKKPYLIDPELKNRASLEVTDRKWHVNVGFEVKFVGEDRSREEYPWLYSMVFTDFLSEEGYDNLLAICYDRVPTRPQELLPSEGIYDDLSTNVKRRVIPASYMKRHFPRIELNVSIPYTSDKGDGRVEAVDFNYMYMSFTSMPIAEDIIIGNDQYSARARFVKRTNGIYLYEIVNAHEMYLDQKNCDDIMEFLLKLAHRKEAKTPAMHVSGKTGEFSEIDIV